MQSDSGRVKDYSSQVVQCGNATREVDLVQMAGKDTSHLQASDAPNEKMDLPSASLEDASRHSVGVEDGTEDIKTVESKSIQQTLLHHCRPEDITPWIDQRALQELRGFSEKENTNANLAKENEKHVISKLKKDLGEMRQLVERVNRERLEAEQSAERYDKRAVEIQFQLEAADATVEEVKAENKSKHSQSKKQLLNSGGHKKWEMQNSFLDAGSVDADSGEAYPELDSSCRVQQMLAERDVQLDALRESHEHFRMSSRRKELALRQEKEEIIGALEESELRSDKQRAELKELECNFSRVRGQVSGLEKRCAAAETKTSQFSSLLSEAQSKLDETTIELFELKNSNAHHEDLRMRLQECERALSLATIQKALAESSLRDLKLRDEHIEEVEQCNRDLEDRLKWRNEQFLSLEEAHSRMQLDFNERRSEWETERAALVPEIDSLRETLASRERCLQDLQNHVQMVHQALSHEENRQKVLELQAAEWRHGLEQPTTGYESAQFSIEAFPERTSTDAGGLRNNFAAKDRQLSDLKVKLLHMEQNCQKLREVEKEYRVWHASHVEQQKQFLALKEKMISVVDAHEKLRSRMREQAENFEQERRDRTKALDSSNNRLLSKDQTVKQLVEELGRANEELEHVKAHRSSIGTQLNKCKQHLEEARVEAGTATEALSSLEARSRVEESLLLDSIQSKDKVVQDMKGRMAIMEQSISEFGIHEKEWVQMQSEYKDLQRQLIQRDADRIEVQKAYESLVLRVSQEEAGWQADREELVTKLDVAQEKINVLEKQLKEVRFCKERRQDLLLKLEARCASHENEIADQCVFAELARDEFVLERIETEQVRKEVTHLKESLSAALVLKNLTIQKLTDQLRNLEAMKANYEETESQNRRICLSDLQMKKSSEIRINTQEHIAAMQLEAHKGNEEKKGLEDLKVTLEEALKEVQGESLQMKRDLEGKLEVARQDCSASYIQFTTARDHLQEESGQNDILLKELGLENIALGELMESKKTLVADMKSLRQTVQVLDTKNTDLLQEFESGNKAFNQVCDKYESARSRFDSSRNEAKDLHSKLQSAQKLSAQLFKTEERCRNLEGFLRAAKAIAQDKEEKLVASEWAVQQLALDVGKVKASLSQKDREEAVLRYELADVERQVREKEGALIELECYLDEAVIAKESMGDEVQKLHKRMEDLDTGAADWKVKEADLTSQLEVIGAALEEKREVLVAFELELKRKSDLQEGMTGAIESLKIQLADEQRALSTQQTNMRRLCEDLERSKREANSSAELVKELQARLQQLQQSSDNRITQFQSTLAEMKDELSLNHVQLEDYQNTVRALTEESSRCKEKYEALTNVSLRKESSLNELQAELFGVKASALKQSKMLEQRDQDLQRATEQRQYHDEKRSCLEETLARVLSQRSELRIDNDELVGKPMKLTGEVDASSNESVLKAKEVESLKLQLEQMRAIVAQGETRMLLAILTDELQASSKAVQDRDARLCASEASFDDVQAECQALHAALATKECDLESLLQKLSTEEEHRELLVEDVLKLEKNLQVAQNALTEQSKVISSHMNRSNAMEVEANEWKGKAELVCKESSTLVQELHVLITRCLESEKKPLDVEEQLKCFQSQLTETTRQLLLHVNSLEELGRDFKLSKESSAAAVEEKLVLKAALAEAEPTGCGKDVANESLNMEFETARGTVSSFDILVNSRQAKCTALRFKESAPEEKGRNLSQQLEAAQKKAELYQQQFAELQEALEKSRHKVKKRAEETSFLVSTLENVQAGVTEWKSKVATPESEAMALKVRLGGAEAKDLQHQGVVAQSKDALTSIEYILIEEKKNSQTLTTVERHLTKEKMKVENFSSLLAQLEAKVKKLENKIWSAAIEGEIANQEVLQIRDAMLTMQHALDKERRSMQLLAGIQHDLAEERMKAAESAKLIADLHGRVEEWKAKAKDAEKIRERTNQELEVAVSTVSSVQLQLETHNEEKRSLEDRNNVLKDELNAAQEEVFARKEKMMSFLLELERSQATAKTRLGYLQIEKLILDLDSSVEYELEACKPVELLDPSGSRVFRGGEVKENFVLEEFQASEKWTMIRVNEALEREVDIYRVRAEEAQHEAQQLAEKLDSALLTICARNQIIKQVNDEIVGLRSVIKKLELAMTKRLDHDALSILHRETPTDTSTLETRRDVKQQSSGLGKRKAETQEELYDYLVLCEKLIREKGQLQRQAAGFQRKNRALQKQLQMERTSSEKERRVLDPVDCTPEHLPCGFSGKSVVNLVKPSIPQDVCNGMILGQIYENEVPGILEISQIGRQPPVSPASAIQQKILSIYQTDLNL